MKTILVTGTAGFIGFHTAKKLLEEGHKVIGVDCVNDYYDVRIKHKRMEILEEYENYKFYQEDLAEYHDIEEIFKNHEKIDQIIHLAAQAGVRYSITNPWAYAKSNYLGTLNVFEAAKNHGVKKVIYASTSSVYGSNKEQPFAEHHHTRNQVSVYSATKKANEVLAHAYHDMFGMQMIGVRFFTVYGPYGRPDLALFKFVKNILADKPIDVYNNGDMKRDFTYIDDIVAGLLGIVKNDGLNYEIFNIGGDNPIELMKFVELIEENLDKKAEINFKEMQLGDVKETVADVSKAREMIGYEPKTKIDEGIKIFVDWFVDNKEWLLELEDGKQ